MNSLFLGGRRNGWVGGFSFRRSRVSGRSIGGSSFVLKLEEPPFCQDNNGKWVWLGVVNLPQQ